MRKYIATIAILLSITASAQTPEENLRQLKITLPEVPPVVGTYVDVVRVGNVLYLSGKGPRQTDGTYLTGRLGNNIDIQQGYNAARLTALNQLAVIQRELGSLNRVKKIIRVTGYVNSEPTFYDHPKVINGFSDLMLQIFGDKGKHARTALGVAVLPFNMAVEIEVIVEVESDLK
jgi:enamine deaminase RidA (YjgF/YER057c/UK114 family)